MWLVFKFVLQVAEEFAIVRLETKMITEEKAVMGTSNTTKTEAVQQEWVDDRFIKERDVVTATTIE